MDSLLRFDAYDTLWFREGRPFEQLDEGLAEAKSIFPPSPSTIAGAIAATLNPIAGKPGQDDCLDILRLMALGDESAENQLRLSGPFLADNRKQLFVPAPATLSSRVLRRGENPEKHRHDMTVARRLGVYLPTKGRRLDADGWLPELFKHAEADGEPHENLAAAGAWMRLDDFFAHMNDMAAFRGATGLSSLVFSSYFKAEQRLGIGVDPVSRTASDSQLYSAQHLRPANERDKPEFMLAAMAGRLPQLDVASLDGKVLVLGGKGRFARIAADDFNLDGHLPSRQKPFRMHGGRSFFRLTAMTPVPADQSRWGLPLDGAPFECDIEDLSVETAIMPAKPQHIGVWNRLDPRGLTRIVRCHAPGTTWFVSAPSAAVDDNRDGQVTRRIMQHRFTPAGMKSLGAMGFGMLAIGEWPDRIGTVAGGKA